MTCPRYMYLDFVSWCILMYREVQVQVQVQVLYLYSEGTQASTLWRVSSWSPFRLCSFRCVSSSPSTLTPTASLESTFDRLPVRLSIVYVVTWTWTCIATNRPRYMYLDVSWYVSSVTSRKRIRYMYLDVSYVYPKHDPKCILDSFGIRVKYM